MQCGAISAEWRIDIQGKLTIAAAIAKNDALRLD
jgi:hypothetical protein